MEEFFRTVFGGIFTFVMAVLLGVFYGIIGILALVVSSPFAAIGSIVVFFLTIAVVGHFRQSRYDRNH